jgi:hypothetical protein
LSDETPSIQDLTKLTLFLGRVSSVHLVNLKSYAWIFFNDVKEVSLEYSVETIDRTKPTIFSYDLTLDLTTNDQLEKRYEALQSAVRKLFWKEARIEIKINGQEAYKSE